MGLVVVSLALFALHERPLLNRSRRDRATRVAGGEHGHCKHVAHLGLERRKVVLVPTVPMFHYLLSAHFDLLKLKLS